MVMTFQPISAAAREITADAQRRAETTRHLTEGELGEAMARDFDAAVRSAPSFPRRRRKPAGLSVFLVGAAAGLALAWGCAAVIWGAA